MTTERSRGSPGIAVDPFGGPVIDPTKNVLDLVRSSMLRQDDLRESESRRLDEKIIMENAHTREIMAIRAGHEAELRDKEVNRLNAIRQVDVAAVAVASDRAASAARILETNVQVLAEANRSLVATTAAAQTEALGSIVKPILNRLEAIERTLSETAGRAGVTDPMMTQVLTETRGMREALAATAGIKQGVVETKTGQQLSIGTIATIVGGFIAVAGLGFTAISVTIAVIIFLSR